MKISTAYLNDIGGRDYNDDTVRMISQNDGICVFVGDGLGGYAGGKIASSTAADIIENYGKNNHLLSSEAMMEAAKAANEGVLAEQKRSHGRMKTTMVVLTVEDRQARWMHVGDSRLYYFKNGRLQSQTMDHSVSQMAVLMGEIKQEEIRFHEDRNKVLRALGSGNAKPEISPILSLGEDEHSFLLCTDGFWEYVYEMEMEEFLKKASSPKEWLENMQELLKDRVCREHDNFSAAAVFIG